MIEKLGNIRVTLQDKKVKIMKYYGNLNFIKEKNIESIQNFISKVSKLQEDIHQKMRNSLKILEHQDKQLEKESSFMSFLSNFPNLYEDCLKEQKRRIFFSTFLLNEMEKFKKIINFEKDKKAQFFQETLLNGIEYYPKNFFPELITEDMTIELYFSNMIAFLEQNFVVEFKGYLDYLYSENS